MGKISVFHHSFGVGVTDKSTLPRTDLERMRLAAEDQTNLLCLATGRGFFRPGLEYLGSSSGNALARIKEFVFGANDASIFEFTDGALRFWVNDLLVTRPAADSAIVNGGFTAAVGWTDGSTQGAFAVIGEDMLQLTATGKGSLAISKQLVTTNSAGTEHALRINVDRGPVTFRCGSTDGGDDYIAETVLRTGIHSLAFTPLGSYWVRFETDAPQLRRVQSIEVEAAGVLSIPTTWAEDDLPLLRMAQSADVVFVACRGQRQRRIERRGFRGEGRSWSIVDYRADVGPFSSGRTASIRLRPSVTIGNGTLTSGKPFFKESQVGALFKIFHTGQRIDANLSGNGLFSEAIEVTGVNNFAATAAEDKYDDRAWSYTISGTWVGTLKVFRSFDGPDFGFKEYRADDSAATIDITANGSGTNTDDDNNAICWYRIGFDDGDYTSGTATISINYAGGSGTGICRVTTFVSSTLVTIEVLRPFTGLVYSDDWQEGQWSDLNGYPTAVALFEGRLWWAGADRFWGSVSDDFESFDEDVEGDSGPINRVVTTGGVNDTQWMMSLQRLMLGTEGTETSARSSSFDEPLTPTNTTLKDATTIGSAALDPVRIDTRGLFVERSGLSIFELNFSADAADYSSSELSKLTKDLFGSGIAGLAVQRRPDTRVWVWLQDGTCVCIVYEPEQEVVAFIPIETDGYVESIAVLPADAQDRPYFMVRRSVNGADVRYLEKMALDSEARPGTLCKLADASISGVNSPASANITGAGHLSGLSVVVWADGAPLTEIVDGLEVAREFVVSADGNITLPSEVTNYVCGLPYRWRYKSARLAYGAGGGTAMLQKKRVDSIGIIMTDFARAGIRYGRKFDDANHPTLPLPAQKDRMTAPAIVSGAVDDEEPFVFEGDWNLDSRVCIEGSSPFPASLLGLVLAVTTND